MCMTNLQYLPIYMHAWSLFLTYTCMPGAHFLPYTSKLGIHFFAIFLHALNQFLFCINACLKYFVAICFYAWSLFLIYLAVCLHAWSVFLGYIFRCLMYFSCLYIIACLKYVFLVDCILCSPSFPCVGVVVGGVIREGNTASCDWMAIGVGRCWKQGGTGSTLYYIQVISDQSWLLTNNNN